MEQEQDQGGQARPPWLHPWIYSKLSLCCSILKLLGLNFFICSSKTKENFHMVAITKEHTKVLEFIVFSNDVLIIGNAMKELDTVFGLV